MWDNMRKEAVISFHAHLSSEGRSKRSFVKEDTT
jgi:hypothetical protein